VDRLSEPRVLILGHIQIGVREKERSATNAQTQDYSYGNGGCDLFLLSIDARSGVTKRGDTEIILKFRTVSRYGAHTRKATFNFRVGGC